MIIKPTGKKSKRNYRIYLLMLLEYNFDGVP